MKFKTYAELISYLLLAKKHQQLLLKNVEQCPSAKEVHTTEMAAKRLRGFKRTQQFRSNSKQKFSSKLKGRTSSNPNRSSGNTPQRRASGGSQ